MSLTFLEFLCADCVLGKKGTFTHAELAEAEVLYAEMKEYIDDNNSPSA